jgi:hypothetical protein
MLGRSGQGPRDVQRSSSEGCFKRKLRDRATVNSGWVVTNPVFPSKIYRVMTAAVGRVLSRVERSSGERGAPSKRAARRMHLVVRFVRIGQW